MELKTIFDAIFGVASTVLGWIFSVMAGASLLSAVFWLTVAYYASRSLR